MIYIIRHGQTNWNVLKKLQGHKSIALNEEGRKEASIIAEKIKYLDFEKIISSDLLRTRETAEIINKNLHKEIILDERLRSIDYGSLEGRFIADITPAEWKVYDYTPEKYSAESVELAYKRIKSLFDELVEQPKSVLLITHGGMLRVITYYIENREVFDNEKYCKIYKDAKQAINTALFEWNKESTKLQPIYY